MAKRVGIVPHLFAQPLFDGLRQHNSASSQFELSEDSFVQLAIKLRQHHLDGAFLSPIDYAKEYLFYRIVPNVCAVSEGVSETVLLVFHENIRRIKTIAIDPRFSSEIVLTRLILAEKYDTIPQFILSSGTIEQALTQPDAVLVVGDAALAVKDTKNKLDLIDEWTDIIGLPFIHGFWVSREDGLTTSEMTTLIEGAHRGVQNLRRFGDDFNHQCLERFQYDFNERAISGLNEFFRMAYYHGILKDIPDVKFHTLERKFDVSLMNKN